MGKPFKKELDNIPSTIEWACNQSIDLLSDFFANDPNTPLFIVGSGGSLSACYFAASLYQNNGTIAKAITPLELYYSKESLRNSKVLFISASGRNTDILFSFDIAIKQEPKAILTVCMKKNTLLSKVANNYSVCKSLEYEIPTKKDGFLATNTLVAYYTLLSKSFGFNHLLKPNEFINDGFLLQIKDFVSRMTPDDSLTVLYGGWGQSVAYDIESKFTEAALGNVLLADYRNFGHGRHHWFAKRGGRSSILALITPREKLIAEKTLALIPENIPTFIIESKINSAESSIELLTKSFYLSSLFGELQGIDPGRPGVPEFGSKIYHLKYASFYKSDKDVHFDKATLAILKKTKSKTLKDLSDEEQKFWYLNYNKFLNKLKSTQFGSIVFDYDGTLCSGSERFDGLSLEIVNELIRILEGGVTIGIATGRGQSVRNDLQSKIPKKYWDNVIIGYYNGSDIGMLYDHNHPNKDLPQDSSLKQVFEIINGLKSEYFDFSIESRPFQLTITPINSRHWARLIPLIQNEIMKFPNSKCQFVQSSHSIDIIVREKATKLNLVNVCSSKASNEHRSPHCLCIGDLGQWPGNDFELLSTDFSLSVSEVSNSSDTCWYLAENGQIGIGATLFYINKLIISNNNFLVRL